DPAGRGATVVTFGLGRSGAPGRAGASGPAAPVSAAPVPAGFVPAGFVPDYRVDDAMLVGPGGTVLAAVEDLPRSLPHDLVDGLCAAATAVAAGARVDGCRRALGAFRGLPHRVELVGEARGVRFYDDSKATTPGAVLAALSGFPSAVLIAGGRNKGLDLSVLRSASDHLRAVVAIGEAAGEIVDTFRGCCPVVEAPSMAEAVGRAAAMAETGDAVVLSPACASFDWYTSYGARGDDFARCVRGLGSAAAR
ncbi:MAG: glutamate ligase domain-containing protein, partial [Acidimicrobiales bacterium]